MIIALLTIITLSGPVAQLRSIETFTTNEACAAWLDADADNRAAFTAELSRRLGQTVTVDARCIDLTPGVAA